MQLDSKRVDVKRACYRNNSAIKNEREREGDDGSRTDRINRIDGRQPGSVPPTCEARREGDKKLAPRQTEKRREREGRSLLEKQ